MNRQLFETLAKHGLLTMIQAPTDGGGDADTEAKSAEVIAKPSAPKAEESEPAQETDWKAEARKWEARAKEHRTAAEKLAELEESQKSESQKQADRMAELESKVKEYETRDQVKAWAEEIVKDSNIPADTLRGSTREELEKHFEQIRSLMPKEPEPKKGAVAPYVADEGNGSSRLPKDTEPSPGRGRMRAAYAQTVKK